ncbi:hypothetical protein BJ742DRAFT_815102 [Cladochytrium replicatum]|nr:hypothetical protein BJ742DRAFT_815102 [Cladochytrium replicatum]
MDLRGPTGELFPLNGPRTTINDPSSRTPKFPTYSSAKNLQLAASGVSTAKSSRTPYVKPFHDITNNSEELQQSNIELKLSNKRRDDTPARCASAHKQHKGTLAKDTDSRQKPTLNQYLEKFKTFTFFFDILDENEKTRYRDLAFELGSKVAAFLAKGVTHLIICNRSIQGKEGHSQTYRDQQRKVASAQKLGIKIWDAERFQSLATKIASQVSRERNPRLYSLHEAITGQPPEIHLFAGKFLLVEDLRRKFKPVIVKEFCESSDKEHSPWPKLQFNNRNGRCAFAVHHSDNPNEFAANDQKNARNFRKRDGDAADRIIIPLPNTVKQGVPFIASGIVSGSNALSFKKPTNDAINNKIGRLEQRLTNMQQISGRASVAGGNKASAKDCGSRKRARFDEKEAKPVGKAFYKRSGYCENCGVRYDEFIKHIKSKEHRDFANCDSHFADIDDFITLELGRPLAGHMIDMTVDLENDREGQDSDIGDLCKSPASENGSEMVDDAHNDASTLLHHKNECETSEVLGDKAVSISELSEDSANSSSKDIVSSLRKRKFDSKADLEPSIEMQACQVQPLSEITCLAMDNVFVPAVSLAPEEIVPDAPAPLITSKNHMRSKLDQENEHRVATPVKFNEEPTPVRKSEHAPSECFCILCVQNSDESDMSDAVCYSDG